MTGTWYVGSADQKESRKRGPSFCFEKEGKEAVPAAAGTGTWAQVNKGFSPLGTVKRYPLLLNSYRGEQLLTVL